MNSIVIGVAGGTCSGKSTFTNNIKARFKDDVVVMYHDNYYKDRSNIAMKERDSINYDCPEALETEYFVDQISQLKRGKRVESPIYNFRTHCRLKDSILIDPKRIIIVEGILVLWEKSIRDLLDIKIFVDEEADIRIIRRLLRDMDERGRSISGIVQQYLSSVKQMHDLYVEPTKKYADVIITGGKNEISLSVVCAKLKEHLSEM